jgi:hypothetical protein
MLRTRFSLIVCPFCFLFTAFTSSLLGGERENLEERTIKALGGTVFRDVKAAGKPIVEVHLESPTLADADLACLRKLKNLKMLYIGDAKITNAGLKVYWFSLKWNFARFELATKG